MISSRRVWRGRRLRTNVSVNAAGELATNDADFLLDNGANVIVVRDNWVAKLLFNVHTTNLPFVYMNKFPARVSLVGSLCVVWRDVRTNNCVMMKYDNVCVVPASRYNILGWNAHWKAFRKLYNNYPVMSLKGPNARFEAKPGVPLRGYHKGGLSFLKVDKKAMVEVATARRQVVVTTRGAARNRSLQQQQTKLKNAKLSPHSRTLKNKTKENKPRHGPSVDGIPAVIQKSLLAPKKGGNAVAQDSCAQKTQHAQASTEEGLAVSGGKNLPAEGARSATKGPAEQGGAPEVRVKTKKVRFEQTPGQTQKTHSSWTEVLAEELSDNDVSCDAAAGEGPVPDDDAVVRLLLEKRAAKARVDAIAFVQKAHARLSHIGLDVLKILIRKEEIGKSLAQRVRKAALSLTAEDVECLDCKKSMTGKHKPGKGAPPHREGAFGSDLQGKIRVKGVGGFRYRMLVVAPANKRVWSIHLKHKSEAAKVIKGNIKAWENDTGEKCRVWRADRGELKSNKMQKFAGRHGFQLEFTAPGSSSGPKEGFIGALTKRSVAARLRSGLPKSTWPWADRHATISSDLLPSKAAKYKSRYERRTGLKPQLHRIQPFGCLATVNRTKQARGSQGEGGDEVTHLHMCDDGAGWVFWDHKSPGWQTFTSDSATFFPDRFPAKEKKEHQEVVKEAAKLMAKLKSKSKAKGLRKTSGKRAKGTRGPSLRRAAAPPRFDPDLYEAAQKMEKEKAKKVGTGAVLVSERYDMIGGVPQKRYHRGVLLHESWGVPDFGGDARLEAHMTSFWEEQAAASSKRTLVWEDVQKLPDGPEKSRYLAAWEEEWGRHCEKKTMSRSRVRRDPAHRFGRRLGKDGVPTITTMVLFEKKRLDSEAPLPMGPTYVQDEDGSKWRYKSRLVVRGNEQIPSDHGSTFAPTPSKRSFRLIHALAVKRGWETHSCDVKTAFLHGKLPAEERVRVVLPRGLRGKGGERLDKMEWDVWNSVYGLRQAPRVWHFHIADTLRRLGFRPTKTDNCVFVQKDARGRIKLALSLHVDDLCIGGKREDVESFKARLKEVYQLTDEGEAKYHLHIRIRWSEDRSSVTLSQEDFVKDLLQSTGMEDARGMSTPAYDRRGGGINLGTSEGLAGKIPRRAPTPEEQEQINLWEAKRGGYLSVVGKLSYLADTTRPDLAYAVTRLQIRAHDFDLETCTAVDKVLSYLKANPALGICFRKGGRGQCCFHDQGGYNINKGERPIIGWTDASWANCELTRRSMTGYVFIFAGGPLSWRCRKLPFVSRSTAESELVALDEAVREALSVRALGMELGIVGGDCIPVKEDNQATTNFAHGTPPGDRLKHVDVKYFAVKEDQEAGRVSVEKVASQHNLADIFTKALGRMKFASLRGQMGVVYAGKPAIQA